jgi:hypothetical protein
MTTAILILSYLLWLSDVVEVHERKPSNIVISSALITLLTWQISVSWGIVVLIVGSIYTLYGLLANTR